jgi:hypothetical protein
MTSQNETPKTPNPDETTESGARRIDTQTMMAIAQHESENRPSSTPSRCRRPPRMCPPPGDIRTISDDSGLPTRCSVTPTEFRDMRRGCHPRCA